MWLLGSVKEKVKLKAIRGKRGKTKDGIKSIRCVAISTDGKFLVSSNKTFLFYKNILWRVSSRDVNSFSLGNRR